MCCVSALCLSGVLRCCSLMESFTIPTVFQVSRLWISSLLEMIGWGLSNPCVGSSAWCVWRGRSPHWKFCPSPLGCPPFNLSSGAGRLWCGLTTKALSVHPERVVQELGIIAGLFMTFGCMRYKTILTSGLKEYRLMTTLRTPRQGGLIRSWKSCGSSVRACGRSLSWLVCTSMASQYSHSGAPLAVGLCCVA